MGIEPTSTSTSKKTIEMLFSRIWNSKTQMGSSQARLKRNKISKPQTRILSIYSSQTTIEIKVIFHDFYNKSIHVRFNCYNMSLYIYNNNNNLMLFYRLSVSKCFSPWAPSDLPTPEAQHLLLSACARCARCARCAPCACCRARLGVAVRKVDWLRRGEGTGRCLVCRWIPKLWWLKLGQPLWSSWIIWEITRNNGELSQSKVWVSWIMERAPSQKKGNLLGKTVFF
jgi:hypothetical protein